MNRRQRGDLIHSLWRLYVMRQALYLVNTLSQEIQSYFTYIKSCPYSIKQLVFLYTLSPFGRITKDLSSLLCVFILSPHPKGL